MLYKSNTSGSFYCLVLQIYVYNSVLTYVIQIDV